MSMHRSELAQTGDLGPINEHAVVYYDFKEIIQILISKVRREEYD